MTIPTGTGQCLYHCLASRTPKKLSLYCIEKDCPKRQSYSLLFSFTICGICMQFLILCTDESTQSKTYGFSQPFIPPPPFSPSITTMQSTQYIACINIAGYSLSTSWLKKERNLYSTFHSRRENKLGLFNNTIYTYTLL